MIGQRIINNILGNKIKVDKVSFNKKGQYGCRECQCTPEDNYCSCLCHEGEGDL